MTADDRQEVRQDATVIGLVGFAHSTSHFFQLLIPPLFPWLMPHFGLNYTEVGSLMTAFFVISGAGQALAGFPVDRFGSWRVLCLGVFSLILSALVLACATSYAMLFLSAVLAGMGNCVFHPADYGLLNRRVSPSRLGHAFSVHGLSGNLGWAAGPVLMVGVASLAGWRIAAASAAVIGSVALLLLLSRRRLLDDSAVLAKAQAAPAGDSGGGIPGSADSPLAFLGLSIVWWCFAFFFLITMSFGVLQNFAPVLLSHLYGLSLALASTSLTAYLLGSAGGMLAGGFVAARGVHHRVVAGALTAAACVSLLLASGLPPGWAVPAVMAMMGFGVGLAGPSRDLLVRRAATRDTGKNAYGRVYGFVYSGLDIGFACAPLAFGPMLDAGHYSPALYGIVVLQVLAVLTALRVGAGSPQAAPA